MNAGFSQLLMLAVGAILTLATGSTVAAATCEDVFAEASSSRLISVLQQKGFATEITVDRSQAAVLPEAARHALLSNLDFLATRLGFFGHESVKTVVYPASGFDAGTPFRVFPSAETVIGLDNHPFTMKLSELTRLNRLSLTRQASGGWVKYRDIDELRSLSESIVVAIELAAVSVHGDAVRIRRILEVETEDQEFIYPIVHGIVEFDHGDGTPLRRYIHLHTKMEASQAELPEWIDGLIASGYDAIFSKAAMDFFYPYVNSLGGYLLDQLNRRGGVFVDTDGGKGSMWPWESRHEQQRRGVTLKHVLMEPIGYGMPVVVEFKPDNDFK